MVRDIFGGIESSPLAERSDRPLYSAGAIDTNSFGLLRDLVTRFTEATDLQLSEYTLEDDERERLHAARNLDGQVFLDTLIAELDHEASPSQMEYLNFLLNPVVSELTQAGTKRLNIDYGMLDHPPRAATVGTDLRGRPDDRLAIAYTMPVGIRGIHCAVGARSAHVDFSVHAGGLGLGSSLEDARVHFKLLEQEPTFYYGQFRIPEGRIAPKRTDLYIANVTEVSDWYSHINLYSISLHVAGKVLHPKLPPDFFEKGNRLLIAEDAARTLKPHRIFRKRNPEFVEAEPGWMEVKPR